VFRIRLNQGSISFIPRTWLGRLALAAGAAALLLLAVFLAVFLLAAALVAAVLLSLVTALRARRLRRGLRREAPDVVVLPRSGRDRFGR
jgi:membrane protein implicated in regulation of membrane protease activity